MVYFGAHIVIFPGVNIPEISTPYLVYLEGHLLELQDVASGFR